MCISWNIDVLSCLLSGLERDIFSLVLIAGCIVIITICAACLAIAHLLCLRQTYFDTELIPGKKPVKASTRPVV